MAQPRSRLVTTLLIITLIPPLGVLAFFVGLIGWLFIKVFMESTVAGVALVVFMFIFFAFGMWSWLMIFRWLAKHGWFPELRPTKKLRTTDSDPSDPGL